MTDQPMPRPTAQQLADIREERDWLMTDEWTVYGEHVVSDGDCTSIVATDFRFAGDRDFTAHAPAAISMLLRECEELRRERDEAVKR